VLTLSLAPVLTSPNQSWSARRPSPDGYLETTEAECLASGFIFTEGPLWHPDDYWYLSIFAATSCFV
jgi:hypothetical protein